jgi:hypothetical protein
LMCKTTRILKARNPQRTTFPKASQGNKLNLSK